MKCFKNILNIHHRQIPFIQDTTSDRKYQNTEKNKSSTCEQLSISLLPLLTPLLLQNILMGK